MADIRKFNSILNAKAKSIGINSREYKYYSGANSLNALKQDHTQFASKQDFLSFCEEIQKDLLSKTISKENFIARGKNGKVYRIPGTNCAVKIPNECATIPIKPINKNVTQQQKVNYVLGKIGDDIDIIKYIDGKNVHQLTRRGLSVPKILLNMPHESYKGYIEKLQDAARTGMYHDFGGANTLINEKYRFMIPIDFHPSLTKKLNPVEDIYFQFGNFMKSQKEQNTLLAKSALAYVDLIRTNKTDSKILSRSDVSLRKIIDCFMPESTEFFLQIEGHLKKITGLKKLESISPEIKKSLEEEITKFNDFIAKSLTER